MNDSTQIQYSAAGGVVVDGASVLVLVRPARGEVRLPKGHVEPGESVESAAVREVAEESGYAGRILADLGFQTVEFDHGGRHVVRSERYFLMELAEGARAVPPAESNMDIFPEEDRRDACPTCGAGILPAERTKSAPRPCEPQFEPKWVGWDEALVALTFEGEREWLRRARRAAGA